MPRKNRTPTRKPPKPRRAPRALTARQLRFVQEYLVDFNGTKAAERAGYAVGSAHVAASGLLRNPKVQKALGVRAKKASERLELKASTLLDVALTISVGDRRRLFKQGPRGGRSVPRDILELDDDDERLVENYRPRADGGAELAIEPRRHYLKMLFQHMGLLKEHIVLDQKSELTPYEQERIASLTDAELKEFDEANDTIHRLLYPQEATTT